MDARSLLAMSCVGALSWFEHDAPCLAPALCCRKRVERWVLFSFVVFGGCKRDLGPQIRFSWARRIVSAYFCSHSRARCLA